MKTIIAAVAALAALTGCAVPQQPGYYATTTRVQDPYQWHTVAVMPPGSSSQSGTWTEELPQRSTTTYVATQPAYTTTYVSQPVYYAPAPSYYYPPVSIGLDFMFSNRSWGGHRGGWGGRGGHHRR